MLVYYVPISKIKIFNTTWLCWLNLIAEFNVASALIVQLFNSRILSPIH